MVPQDGFLFDATVADNVRYGRPGMTDAQIAVAFEELGLGDWVDGLAEGVGTAVGQRGDSLSAGERQLVAVARAYVADPDLLVLDEATSAVDPATEQRLTRALDTLTSGRTTLNRAPALHGRAGRRDPGRRRRARRPARHPGDALGRRRRRLSGRARRGGTRTAEPRSSPHRRTWPRCCSRGARDARAVVACGRLAGGATRAVGDRAAQDGVLAACGHARRQARFSPPPARAAVSRCGGGHPPGRLRGG